MKILFIHGGPGLNSETERRLLDPIANPSGMQFLFWNEPSSLRRNGSQFSQEDAYTNSVRSAELAVFELAPGEDQVHLVAHSFGANIAVDVAQKQSQKIASITLIAPALDMNSAFKNLMRLALKDAVERSDLKTAQTLEASLIGSNTFYDQAMQEGMSLVPQSPKFLSFYFSDAAARQKWIAVIQEPEFAPDSVSQAAVLQSYKPEWKTSQLPKQAIPVQILFGEKDPFISQQIEVQLAQSLFLNVQSSVFPDNCHFLHLENPSRLIQSLEIFQIKNSDQATFNKPSPIDRADISKRLSQTSL